MNSESTGGFYELRQNILSLASPIVVEKTEINPDSLLETFESDGEIESYLESFSKLKTDEDYNRYRHVCLDLFEVETQMRRVETILTLLQLPSVSQFSPSEWIDYHHDYWHIAVYSLLDRVQKLSTHIVRHLIRPHNTHWKTIQDESSDRLQSMKTEVSKMRNPIAHTGGAVTAVDEENILPIYILFGDHLNYSKNWYGTTTHQEEWPTRLRSVTDMIRAEIDRISERLLVELPQ